MPLRIYIVEDEMINALCLRNELQQNGFEVCGMAAHSAAAVVGMTENRPDLVLMDINLGIGPNGIETARLIQEQLDVSIIFMTGYRDREIRRQAEALIPLACLDKPLDIPLLLELLAGLTPGAGKDEGSPQRRGIVMPD
jgi:CheY-like chemotaxis protein